MGREEAAASRCGLLLHLLVVWSFTVTLSSCRAPGREFDTAFTVDDGAILSLWFGVSNQIREDQKPRLCKQLDLHRKAPHMRPRKAPTANPATPALQDAPERQHQARPTPSPSPPQTTRATAQQTRNQSVPGAHDLRAQYARPPPTPLQSNKIDKDGIADEQIWQVVGRRRDSAYRGARGWNSSCGLVWIRR